MRMSREEKERSHRRIVASAASIMRRCGVEGTGVSDVMRDAGLTHGGFYKHFDSKEALLVAALDTAFDEIATQLRPDVATSDTGRVAKRFERFYLSHAHVATPARGCPVAALGNDIGRGSPDLKARFGAGVRRIVDLLARGSSGKVEARRVRAIRQFALMAGAVTIARACDPETAAEVLKACRPPS